MPLPGGRYATVRVHPDAASMQRDADRAHAACGLTVPRTDNGDSAWVTFDLLRGDGSKTPQRGALFLTEASADREADVARLAGHLADAVLGDAAKGSPALRARETMDSLFRAQLVGEVCSRVRHWRKQLVAHRRGVSELVNRGLATSTGDGPWDEVRLTELGLRVHGTVGTAARHVAEALRREDESSSILREYVGATASGTATLGTAKPDPLEELVRITGASREECGSALQEARFARTHLAGFDPVGEALDVLRKRGQKTVHMAKGVNDFFTEL